MRLFVDVDDTLIHWNDIPGRKFEFDPSVCPAIVEFVERWKTHNPDGEIIVWSLGGKAYAEELVYEHAPRLFLIIDKFRDKTPTIVYGSDLFIDDDPLPFYRSQNLHPDILRN